MLTVWLNFAYIEHQLDITPEHHSQHHCQLFASAHHGASTPPLIWFNTPSIEVREPQPLVAQTFYFPFSYQARSPPIV
ncbi:DUF2607 family protein [Vibrio sp. TRT 17S01]|uniref:DUF2607 family protein n=1 Tax=Vibrio sp. TRT 17S01 TaxID=3418505 RepID=UPI003CE80B60